MGRDGLHADRQHCQNKTKVGLKGTQGAAISGVVGGQNKTKVGLKGVLTGGSIYTAATSE